MSIQITGGSASAPAASETVAGVVELATTVEAAAGTDTARAVTPAGLGLRKIGDGWALGSGGNARGVGAVDLQITRTDPAQVASGLQATIGGGYNNTASGMLSAVIGGQGNTVSGDSATVSGGYGNTASLGYTTVGGGQDNTASGGQSTVGGGKSNTASEEQATISGGYNNTASGSGATVGGGRNNTASGNNATVGGGYNNTASGLLSVVSGGGNAKADKRGQNAQASGWFAFSGDAQTSVLVARCTTPSATPVPLSLDGAGVLCPIADDTTWAFTVVVVARRTDADNESAAYQFLGCIDNNAGTTALVGTVAKTVIAEDSAGWDCNVTADDPNNALRITATGEAGKTIRWVARIELVEVTG